MSIRSVIIIVLLIVLTLFTLQQIEPTTVFLLFWYARRPLALFLTLRWGIGILIGLMIPRTKG